MVHVLAGGTTITTPAVGTGPTTTTPGGENVTVATTTGNFSKLYRHTIFKESRICDPEKAMETFLCSFNLDLIKC